MHEINFCLHIIWFLCRKLVFVITASTKTCSNVPVDIHCLVCGYHKHSLQEWLLTHHLTCKFWQASWNPTSQKWFYLSAHDHWMVNGKVSLEAASRTQGSPCFPESLISSKSGFLTWFLTSPYCISSYNVPDHVSEALHISPLPSPHTQARWHLASWLEESDERWRLRKGESLSHVLNFNIQVLFRDIILI